MLSVYADGSSSGGKKGMGPGGYGWVIVKNGEVLYWGYGSSPVTTNNLMETEGAIQGLLCVLDRGLHQNNVVELVSDSQYTLGMASAIWHPDKNLEQVARLRDLAVRAGVKHFRWVRGHNGERFNEMCDILAGEGKVEATPEHLRKPEKTPRKVARRERRQKARQAVRSREAADQEGLGEGT